MPLVNQEGNYVVLLHIYSLYLYEEADIYACILPQEVLNFVSHETLFKILM